MISPVIETKERRVLLAGSVLIVLLALLPNLAGYMLQTPQMRFNGAAFDWPDIATHLTAIRSGMEGNWQFKLFYTPGPQKGYYIKLFYIILGNLFRASQAKPIIIYYTSLVTMNLAACLIVYRFIAEFISKPRYRTIAFLLAIFGSGLGWLMNTLDLLPKAGYSPIDLWHIDAYPYKGMIVFPHFSFVIICQLGFILLFLRYRTQERKIHLIWMAAIGLILQTIQPYAPMIPFMVTGGMIFGEWITNKTFPWKEVFTLSLVGLLQIPLLVYNILVFSSDPIWTTFADQNQTLSPPPVYYFWGFFWFWLLLLPAMLKMKIFLDTKRVGLLVWVFGTLVLAYLPWQMQRRFFLYYTLPLAILVTLVIQEVISPWLDRRIPFLAERKMVQLVSLVVIVGFSNLYLMVVTINTEFAQYKSYHFHPVEISQALGWLKENTRESTLMVSSPNTGLLAGVQAEQSVFIAHQFETAGYDERFVLVTQFYQNEIDIDALGTAKPEWIFYGPYERGLNPDFQPPADFRIAYQESGVTIYQFDGEP